MAQDIAWTWANHFVEWRTAENLDLPKEDRVGAAILDVPTVSLHKPKTQINVMAAAIIGLLVGGLIVFVLEWMESDTIRSTQDVERHNGVARIGNDSAFRRRSAKRQTSATDRLRLVQDIPMILLQMEEDFR